MAEHPGHERTDADAGPLALVGITMAVLVVGAFVSMVILYKVFAYYQPMLSDDPHPLAELRQVTTEPRLQVDPPRQKFELKEIEENVLSGYDWVDREEGIVRIPVNRAIEILAERGLPIKTGSGAATEATETENEK